MPALEMYRGLAPFSARELIESANTLLRSKPELGLTERTLRYYVSEGMLPPPDGPSKFARYSFEHLVAIVAIRFLQDHGINLDRIREEIRGVFVPGDAAAGLITAKLGEWLSRREDLPPQAVEERFFASPNIAEPAPASGFARGRSPRSAESGSELSTILHMVAELRHEMQLQRRRSHATITTPPPAEAATMDAIEQVSQAVLDLGQQVNALGPERDLMMLHHLDRRDSEAVRAAEAIERFGDEVRHMTNEVTSAIHLLLKQVEAQNNLMEMLARRLAAESQPNAKMPQDPPAEWA